MCEMRHGRPRLNRFPSFLSLLDRILRLQKSGNRHLSEFKQMLINLEA